MAGVGGRVTGSVPNDRRRICDRLGDGERCYTLGIRTARNVDFVRMAASVGYDLIWVDLEHSTIPLDIAGQMCAAARNLGMEAWVRTPEGDRGAIGRVLDAGASGVIVPQVTTAAEAREAVACCRYPPRGARSHNALTATTAFRRLPGRERVDIVDRDTVVQVLLETPEAIANVDAIAAVDGIDIVGLGLNDLSATLGRLGQVEDEEIAVHCRRVIAAAQRHGKLALIGGVAGPAHFASLVALGAAPFVFAAIDTDLFVEALTRRLETWRAPSRA
jgi:2-keto-3-deoxy-L-rhamnonate aldolase RhmA